MPATPDVTTTPDIIHHHSGRNPPPCLTSPPPRRMSPNSGRNPPPCRTPPPSRQTSPTLVRLVRILWTQQTRRNFVDAAAVAASLLTQQTRRKNPLLSRWEKPPSRWPATFAAIAVGISLPEYDVAPELSDGGGSKLGDGGCEKVGDLSLESIEDEEVATVDEVFEGAFGALGDKTCLEMEALVDVMEVMVVDDN
ncbi:hypothetical protein Tco_1393042 [Tanacetum coccineum]